MNPEPFGDNRMANLMRNNHMKNHYSAMVHVKSDIGKYMNKKPPIHIKKKVV